MFKALRISSLLGIPMLGGLLPGNARQPASALAITHVTVIDTVRGAALPDRTVVVRSDEILAVARTARVPDGATIVDGSGKYLIPGLWDMHVHTLNPQWIETFFPLSIANGVTGVRDMARPLAAKTS